MRALRQPTAISIRLFLLFILLASFQVVVNADEDKDYDEYEETARVARVSLIEGDVQLRRSGSDAWERARLNLPLVEGDVLATTGQDARLELHIDARNFLRVGGDSVIRLVTLREEGVALSLSEGTATLRLARFDRDKEYFEIDAPGTTLAAEKKGVYRLDVSRDGRVRLTVRNDGQARIYSETSGFTLRDDRSAELVLNGTEAGDWELSRASSFDAWDTWVGEREHYLAERLRFDGRERYYDGDIWGAEELDAYGDWVYSDEYGWVWRPNRTSISHYSDWAPYRYGHWTWVPPYGWTWVGDEPWGWAPYHYGRWVYYNNSWCWTSRAYGNARRRAWWRPALVVFVYVPSSYGERVCWYPLNYRQRDPRGRHYRRLESLHSRDIARLQRTNPAHLRAITTLPAREFGRRGVRTQQATAEIARRAITAEPIRGRLPIEPTDSAGGGRRAADNNRRETRTNPVRPPRQGGDSSAPDLLPRPTGAATRTPGIALDEELRRTRLYNRREPRPAADAGGNTGAGVGGSGRGGIFDRIDSGNTGAVARPGRRRPTETQPLERGAPNNDANPVTPSAERPIRPPRMNPAGEQTPGLTPNVERPDTGDAESTPAVPRVRPRRDDNDGNQVEPRPTRRSEQRPESRPEPQPENRPEPRFEPRPERRTEPRTESRPEPRPESRPEPREERRSEPRPEPRPEPRQEPAPSAPAPAPEPRQESRPEPPPPREEPKQEAPRERPVDVERPSRRDP
jgi:hypothetical protein